MHTHISCALWTLEYLQKGPFQPFPLVLGRIAKANWLRRIRRRCDWRKGLLVQGVTTSRATSGGRRKDRNTSGQRGSKFNRSYRNISVVVVENNGVVKPKCQQYTSLYKMLSSFSKALIAHISFTAVINNGGIGKGIGGIRKVPRRIYALWLAVWRAWWKKENQSHGPQIILPPSPKKFLNFAKLRLFLFVGPAKPLWSLAFL